MIKTEEFEDKVIRHKIVSVLCNRCGAEMKTDFSPKGNGINVVYEGGYDSDEFGDGSIVEFDLCEGCMSQMIEDFAIPPHIMHAYAEEDDS